MRETAHDLADRAAVNAEIVGRSRLAPPKNLHGMKDVAGRQSVARKLVRHR